MEVNYADISFTAKDIPACGYKIFIIKAINDVRMSKEYETDIRAGRDYIENRYYKIIAEKANGTVTIVDKLNDKLFKNCHRFVDGGMQEMNILIPHLTIKKSIWKSSE